MKPMQPIPMVLAGAMVVWAGGAVAQTVFSAAGSPAGIQSTVDAFRSDLGTLNPNVAGAFASGRREINWDGVPDATSAPANLPADFFNVNSPRGVVFATPGTGFQVSGNAGSAGIEFANLNPQYPTLFTTFSPVKLFTALGSTITDVNFFVPGAATPALTRGFGAVFTDVDLANTTTLQFIGASGANLGTFNVPNAAGNETLSFLGVAFPGALVSRVRITSGNASPGTAETGALDVVAMDDFIYGEPLAVATAGPVPEPATLAFLSAGLLALGLRRKRAVSR